MRGWRIALGVAVLTTCGSSAALAAVNCAQVKKYLDVGRTAQDVSDTMVVPLDEVKKCQTGGDSKAPGPTIAAPAAAHPAADTGKK